MAGSDEGRVNIGLWMVLGLACVLGILWLSGQIAAWLFAGAWPQASLREFDIAHFARNPLDPGGAWPETVQARPPTAGFYGVFLVLLILVTVGFGVLMRAFSPGDRGQQQERQRRGAPARPLAPPKKRRRWFDPTRADAIAGGPPGASSLAGGVALSPVQEGWNSPEAKYQAVLRVLRGEPFDAVAIDLGVDRYQLEAWHNEFLDAGLNAMKSETPDPDEERIHELERRLGELSIENQILRSRLSEQGIQS